MKGLGQHSLQVDDLILQLQTDPITLPSFSEFASRTTDRYSHALRSSINQTLESRKLVRNSFSTEEEFMCQMQAICVPDKLVAFMTIQDGPIRRSAYNQIVS